MLTRELYAIRIQMNTNRIQLLLCQDLEASWTPTIPNHGARPFPLPGR
jgi:hypothetical protein